MDPEGVMGRRLVPLMALLAVCSFALGHGGTLCERAKPECTGADCTELVDCHHGFCDAEGNCECLPCFSGPTCSNYDDIYGPRFAIREDTVIIVSHHQGVVYKAVAEDEDLGLTCPLGPGLNTRCPCATIHYSLGDQQADDAPGVFDIHDSSGQIFLKPGVVLEPGRHYEVKILASNTNNTKKEPEHPMMDVQTLTVVVHSDDGLQDLLQQDSLPTNSVAITYEVEYQEDPDTKDTGESYGPGESDYAGVEEETTLLEPETLVRKKRFATGPEGTAQDAKLTLTVVKASPQSILQPGNSVGYRLDMALPKMTITAMDLLVEIFVMDAVSGITPFALCEVSVDSVGVQIKDESGGAIDINAIVIDNKLNNFFGTFYDRAIINFGKLMNEDTFDPANPSADTTDSTISVSFTAVLIKNADYQNATAIVSVGAEYDTENLVWVSQDTYNYDMNPAGPFDVIPTLTAPSTPIPKFAGGTFKVDSFVSHPFAKLLFEVTTADNIPDKFSVSQIYVTGMGEKWACTSRDSIVVTYHPTASGRTDHRATIEIQLLMKELDYATDLASYSTDDKFKIEFGFNIFVEDAMDGDVLEVGVNLKIDSTQVWSDSASVTVGPQGPHPPPTSPVTWVDDVTNLTPTEVVPEGTATWKVTAEIPSGANSLIECTATGTADTAEVCGVLYGEVGANIAYLPKLPDHVSYASGSAEFSLNFNSTGVYPEASANQVVFEVSVKYPSTASDSVSLVCSDGLSASLDATSKAANQESITGVVENLVSEPTWYAGSQAGLLVKLNFPGGGSAYSDLVLETVADLDVTTYGARVCGGRIVSAGRGVPCIAGHKTLINDAVVLQQGSSALFPDGIKLDLGPACGTERGSSLPERDYEVILKVFYEMPAPQPALAAGTYNLTVGLHMPPNLIWTGWDSFHVDASTPTPPPEVSVFEILPRAAGDILPGVPQLITVVFKPQPGTVGKYTITAEVDDVEIISLCRILILDVGANFPCVDKEPYGKENILYQSTTLVHDSTNWGLRAVLDLGVLRNLGSGSFYSAPIADVDAIAVGVMLKGVTDGAGTLTVTLDDLGTPTVVTQALTVLGPVTPVGGPLGVTVSATDSTPDAYEGVMKLVDFTLTVLEDYQQEVTATLRNTELTDFTICFGAVYSVGENVPCLIPSNVISAKTTTDTEEVLEIALKEVCYYKMSENATENLVVLRVGVMFLPNSALSAFTLNMELTEGSASPATYSFDLTKATTAYVPDPVNTTGLRLSLLENNTVVTPGLRLWTGVAITIPRDVTIPLEVGVMTTFDGGRAFATVHGFRLVQGTHGKNIGCLLGNFDLYTPQITQNSSVTPPPIHESQTDSLTVSLNYITNTGITYGHNVAQPEDDQIWFEADLWIADHPNAPATIDIHFAINAETVIVVIEKPLTLDTSGAREAKIVTEFLLTDPTKTRFAQGDQVGLTARAYHLVNESTQEANDARLRVLMPKYVKFVSGVDTVDSNITGTTTENQYIDFDFGYLFFTDVLEVNLTLTMDPDGILPKGLGVVNATTLLRLVCTTLDSPDYKYCSTTSHVQYEMDGSDCSEALLVDSMDPCQLSASAAIDQNTSPAMAKPTSGSAWCPPVRKGSEWRHYFTIDFLRKTRVSKIIFQAPAGMLQLHTFKIQFSHNAYIFTDACETELKVPENGVVTLPTLCRFQARYGRLLIVSATDVMGGSPVPFGEATFGVRFGDWYGCYLEDSVGTCNTQLKTAYSDDGKGWRHAAHDEVNDILYFCDVTQRSTDLYCFCTKDGFTWKALPSYIGRLVGFDAATGKMCAMDKKDRAMVCSLDGVNWSIVDDILKDTILTAASPPVAIPGQPEGPLGTIAVGGWTADFTGLSKGGTYHAKWDSCCT